MNLSSSSRYLRMGRLVIKLPTYARIVWGIVRDPRTPIGLKGMLVAALAYVVFPVDLIPDAIPIIGQADDLTVLLLVLDLFSQNAPPEVRAEHTTRAKNGTAVGMFVSTNSISSFAFAAVSVWAPPRFRRLRNTGILASGFSAIHSRCSANFKNPDIVPRRLL